MQEAWGGGDVLGERVRHKQRPRPDQGYVTLSCSTACFILSLLSIIGTDITPKKKLALRAPHWHPMGALSSRHIPQALATKGIGISQSVLILCWTVLVNEACIMDPFEVGLIGKEKKNSPLSLWRH